MSHKKISSSTKKQDLAVLAYFYWTKNPKAGNKWDASSSQPSLSEPKRTVPHAFISLVFKGVLNDMVSKFKIIKVN